MLPKRSTALKWRLVASFAVLLVTLALALAWAGRYASQLYFQEVNQSLNRSVAMYVVNELALIESGTVNKAALKLLAERAMTVNPSVEVYLLDTQGRIVDHALPADVVVREAVEMRPVLHFLAEPEAGLILGDDPRGFEHRKAFTAAEIQGPDGLQGYLYVVLGGAQFDAVQAEFLGTFIGRVFLVSLLVFLLVGGLVGYHILTRIARPLEQLDTAVATYVGSEFSDDSQISLVSERVAEVAQLKHALQVLVDRLAQQFAQLATNDALRRELLANVSHDLRTPLASIQGYIETLLIKSDTLSAEDREAYLQTALRHSTRLNSMVVDLFELAKLDSGAVHPKIEQFSLAELLQDVMQEFYLQAQAKDVQLTLDVAQQDQSLKVQGDISLIERVFENLLANALRYTDAGGSVTVQLKPIPDAIGIGVKDSGCGIEAKLLPNLFDRYTQGSDLGNPDGAGLGLAIVKRILDLHGAQIQVNSKVNEGTQFSFALPLSQAA